VKRDQPVRYAIRLAGHIDHQWGDWFDGWTISHEDDGTTILKGPPTDQPALHGLLRKVGDLGMTLISITTAETPPPRFEGRP
jgi:hypothetical protein